MDDSVDRLRKHQIPISKPQAAGKLQKNEAARIAMPSFEINLGFCLRFGDWNLELPPPAVAVLLQEPQITITRHQISSKSQIQNIPVDLPSLAFATLEIAWDLEVGICNFRRRRLLGGLEPGIWIFRDAGRCGWLNIYAA